MNALSPGDLVVRRLAPDDWELARELRLAALEDSPDAFGSTLEREQNLAEHEWRTRLAGAWFAAFAFAAFAPALAALTSPARASSAEPTPVGLACGVPGSDRADARRLVGMWVAPQWRGRNIGDALLAAVLGWARDDGARRLNLWVVETNAPALALYRRHGFEPTGAVTSLEHRPGATLLQLGRHTGNRS